MKENLKVYIATQMNIKAAIRDNKTQADTTEGCHPQAAVPDL